MKVPNLIIIFLLLVTVLLACNQRQENNQPAIKTESVSNKQQKSELPKEVIAVLQSVKKVESQGREMESLRKKDDLKSVSECGDLMRTHQKTAEELKAKSEKLPKPYSAYLTPAITELKMCVSCLSNAIENCNQVLDFVKDVENQVWLNCKNLDLTIQTVNFKQHFSDIYTMSVKLN